MKKIILLVIIIIVFVVSFLISPKLIEKFNETNTPPRPPKSDLQTYNGQLEVDGTNLKNQYDENFQLKGISSHGIQWYSDLITYDNLKFLRDEWKINVFRIAMYTEENGYISNKDSIKSTVTKIVDMAIDLDIYVVIDWHNLSDGKPLQHLDESKEFFSEMSIKYANVPNVIYEICNEPNGQIVTWDKYIKPYADEVIPVIRKNSPNALVIVGTPNWSKDVDIAATNPLNYSNILYACHFYAGTHGDELRKKIQVALDKNIAIFVSEWGTTNKTGNGRAFLDSSTEWINFLNERNISWINWSFCNKDEGSAILKSVEITENFNIDENLSESGEFVKSLLKK